MSYLSPSEPLQSWLPARLDAERDVIATGRARDATLGAWARALDWRREPPDTPARALLVIARLRHPPGVGLELSRWVERGGLVVEVIALSRRFDALAWLLGLEPRLRAERRAALRVVEWADLGLRELEQWGVGEPDALAVTVGRYYPLHTAVDAGDRPGRTTVDDSGSSRA
jgi:hypothetical protein